MTSELKPVPDSWTVWFGRIQALLSTFHCIIVDTIGIIRPANRKITHNDSNYCRTKFFFRFYTQKVDENNECVVLKNAFIYVDAINVVLCIRYCGKFMAGAIAIFRPFFKLKNNSK